MNAVSQVFAVLAAVIYIVVFPLESFLLHRPGAQKFLSTPPQNVAAVMMWAIPTGFRNLVIYCCANMVLTAPAMFLADMQGHYPKKGGSIPGTLGATVPALLALITLPF